jgi:hypothetical protein
MEPTLQGLGAPPQPMSSAPSPMMGAAPNMQAAGAMQPQPQPSIPPQMLMMIRQHMQRQALMQAAIMKAKQAGVRDAQRKMAMSKAGNDNPNDVLGQSLPNDPSFGAAGGGSGGDYRFSNSPGR